MPRADATAVPAARNRRYILRADGGTAERRANRRSIRPANTTAYHRATGTTAGQVRRAGMARMNRVAARYDRPITVNAIGNPNAVTIAPMAKAQKAPIPNAKVK